jgi:hypothetical protein
MLRTVAAVVVAVAPSLSWACGCFAAPDPTVPVVQAGERIVFAVKNGQVTAHVQVLYDGASGQPFGWLVPLPAVPTLSVGTDEFFAELNLATQPRYVLNRTFAESCRFASLGGAAGGSAGGSSGAGGGAAGGSPLVAREIVGPYDSAVLRGDSKDAMLTWLRDNRFFVPSTSDAALAPYINPGSYFLALKLRPGAGTGDLQPIVMKYQSDVGQIPLTLTSIGAVENMGVQVFMLGSGRAVPRNYHHTVINDAYIDWLRGAQNYTSVITRAVGEAPGKHSFVTEYAGPPSIVTDRFPQTGRFGTKAALAAQQTAQAFLSHLWSNGFTALSLSGSTAIPNQIPGPLLAILQRYLPPPPNIAPSQFYFFYGSFSAQAPPQNFQPAMMADEIWERVVVPAQEARALLTENPTLTRLFTTISPADMNKDPAFSFNPTLAPVSNVHQATLTQRCNASGTALADAVLTTEQGWVLYLPDQVNPSLGATPPPTSLRIEVLPEEGAPMVLTDNSGLMGSVPAVPPLPEVPPAFQPDALPDASTPHRTRGCQTGVGLLAVLGVLALRAMKRSRH